MVTHTFLYYYHYHVTYIMIFPLSCQGKNIRRVEASEVDAGGCIRRICCKCATAIGFSMHSILKHVLNTISSGTQLTGVAFSFAHQRTLILTVEIYRAPRRHNLRLLVFVFESYRDVVICLRVRQVINYRNIRASTFARVLIHITCLGLTC